MTVKYKPTLLAALLAAAIALGNVACVKDEPTPAETTDAATTAAAPVTTAAPDTTAAPVTPEPETTAPETTAAPVAEPVNVTVRDLADGFTVRTVGLPAGVGHIQTFPYDDTHLLFSLDMGKQLRLALFDLASGTFAAACNLTPNTMLTQAHYTRDALTLFNFSVKDEAAVLDEAYEIRYANGALTAEPSERAVYPYADHRISSPDGRYQVYRVIEDGVGRAGVDLHLPDGTVKRIFTQYAVGDTLPDGSVASYFGGKGYVPIRFLDNTRLLYRMYGYESGGGFGIYDVATGVDRTYFVEESYSYYGTHDGVFYAAEPGSSTYEFGAFWKISLDGQATRIHTIDPNEPYRVCLDSCWTSSVMGEKDLRMTIYTPDLDGTLAEITVDAPTGLWSANYGWGGRGGNCYVHAEDDTLYLFVSGGVDAVYVGEPPAPVNPHIPEATTVSEGIGINFVSDSYTVRTVPMPGIGQNRSYFGIDERYLLFYTYDYSPEPAAKNQQLHLFDRKLGSFVSTYHLDSSLNTYFHSTYFRGDVYYITDNDIAYAVDYASGILRLSPAEVAWTREDVRVASPDGQYLAYRVTEGRTNEERREHIDLRRADGSVKRLLTGEEGLYYSPVGFLNDSDLLYCVSGEKRDHDFGIINVASGGRYVPAFNRDYHIYGITDGAVYLRNKATGELCRMIDSGSTLTVIGSLPEEASGKVWGFAGNCWKEDFRPNADELIVTLWTLDPGDAMLARLEITEERNRELIWLPGGDCMYIIARGLTDTRTPAMEGYVVLDLADDFKIGTLSAEPTDLSGTAALTSPDGTYTVRQDDLGDVYVTLPDAGEVRILDQLNLDDVLPNGQTVGLGDVISYQPLAFIDSTRLLYGMGGYEWSRGFALIDVATGQITEFPDCAGFTLLGYADGAIYAAQPGSAAYSTAAFWRIDQDGHMVRLYAFPEEAQMLHEHTLGYLFFDGGWLLIQRASLESPTQTLIVWSRDFTERLATVVIDAKLYSTCTPVVAGNTLYLISDDLPEFPIAPATAVHNYDLAYTYRGGVLYDDRSFRVTADLPAAWTPKANTRDLYEGEQKRLSLHSSLYRESFDEFRAELAASPAGVWDFDNPVTGTTARGHRYVGYHLLSKTVPDTTPSDWYLLSLDVSEGYTYRLGVLAYPEDGEDYFARVLRPVIESVTVALGDPVRPFGRELFTHRIFTSATTLRFYVDDADPRYFAVRYYDASLGLDLALDLTIPEGLTYDRARPIYAGGGGGSGECEFIVEFRQGETVTYVSFNNFAYTDNTNWLHFAARVIDADYVAELRQYLPELFY